MFVQTIRDTYLRSRPRHIRYITYNALRSRITTRSVQYSRVPNKRGGENNRGAGNGSI